MDIVTLGAALNGSAEYVNSHFVGGSNIQIVDNLDGTQTINASGEVSSEDTVARADIAEMKDGTTIDSFGDVETALATKANTSTTYTKTEVDTALDDKVDKVSGKGLSTNDYTTAEKTKLAGIAEGAEVNEIEGIKVNNTSVNPDANKVVNITVPTTAADVSALPDTTKYAVALSLTINSSTFVMTGQLKDQNGDNLGTAQTIDLPLESVVVGGSYNSQTKKVVLTLQNGNTIEFSVADLVSGLQTELSASNKLNPAYINYDSTHRAVSDTEKSTWNGKQSALTAAQLAAVNSGIDSAKVEQIETNKNNILSTCCVGTCTTSGNVAAKIVTIDDANWTLRKGCIIAVKFSNSNSVNDTESTPITLNVNNTGAYRIWYKNGAYANARQEKIFGYAGYYIYYMYDGVDRWVWINYSMDSTYGLMSQAEASAGTETNGRLISAKVLSSTIDEKLVPVENNILLNTNNGVKNLLNIPTSQTVHGITFTKDGDEYVTSDTSNDTASYSAANANETMTLSAGTYTIALYPHASNTQSVSLHIMSSDSSDIVYVNTSTPTATFTFAAAQTIYIQYKVNQQKARFMICEKSLYDADTTYQPYALSNAELTAKEQQNENNILLLGYADNIINTTFDWSDGFIWANGSINASSQSQFSQPLLLHAGEKITVKTTNKNIGIICSTTADVVRVGDSVTVLQTTSNIAQEEAYSYTATADIRIVICVLKSNYDAYVSQKSSLPLCDWITLQIRSMQST